MQNKFSQVKLVKNVIHYWLPVIVWAGGIYYLSGIPGLSSGLEMDTVLRKMAHVIEYFVLTLLLHRALKGTFLLSYWVLSVYSGVIAYLYALSDEYHQHFVPMRQGSFLDTLIDALGIAIFLAFRLYRQR